MRPLRPFATLAVATVLAAVLAGACGDDSTGPRGAPGCDESTVVSVSAGVEPTFSWSGGCRVQGVSVVQSSPFRVMWSFSATNDQQINVFGSPIRYGQLPATGGVRLDTEAIPLVAGREYQVVLYATGRAGCGGFTGCVPVAAGATFVP
jgi:hypothetical protein